MHPLFEIKNVSCERNERWLFQNLSFSVAAGQILQIIGPNGSGKTSLLKILTGLMPLNAGEILWQQRNIAEQRLAYFDQLLYIGHLSGITGALTATENLNFYKQALAGQQTAIDTKTALQQIGLAAYIDAPAATLSAGQQRRISLARLLFSTARLWILDEPLTALDQQGVALIQTLLTRHLQQQGLVVLTSHQPLHLADINIEELYL